MEPRGSFAAYRAAAKASQILAGIHVSLRWKFNPKTCPADGILVQLGDDTPSAEHPGALAYTTPYGARRIVVFYDRVSTAVAHAQEPSLFGYVLAHEITHVVQGMITHSETGIMKEKWTARDFAEMHRDRLRFTPEDIELVDLGLRHAGPSPALRNSAAATGTR